MDYNKQQTQQQNPLSIPQSTFKPPHYKVQLRKLHKSLLVCFILLALALPSQCATDITLLNCPSQYNITKANITTQSSIALINSYYSIFETTADNNRIQDIVISGDTDDLWSYIKQKIVPYAIYGGIIFAIFLLMLYYCLFDKSFPPCQRLRRNPLQKPYTKVQRRCMSYWLLIFACIIFSLGIVSFTTIPSMKSYLSYTKCTIYNLIDIGINGDINKGWGGFLDLKYKIGNITSLLDSTGTQVSTYITGNSWLIDNMFVMKNKNIQLYGRNSNAKYTTPNPDTTQTNVAAGLPIPLVDSVFIRNKLGPNGTFNTMVDDIDRGLRTTQIKSSQAYQIQLSAKAMIQTTDAIKVNSAAAQNTLSMYLRQLQVVKTEMDTFSVKFFDNYFSLGVYVLQGVVGFILVSSLLVLIGGLSTHFYQIFECRYMVHCGWFLYSLMYFGMLLLAFVSISLGTVGYYACQYMNSSMTNQSSFYKLRNQYSQNVLNRLDTCILGDGNALKKFNIYNQMHTVTDLFTNISQYYDYDNPLSKNYIDMAISANKINGWINQIEKYRLGINIDSRTQQTTNDNPNYAINQMNLYSNTGGGVRTCSKDRWVFDSSQCNRPNQTTYQADATLANGQAINNNSIICISFNQKLTTSMSTSWSQADLMYRYLQIRQLCPDAYNKIVFFGLTLINYRNSRLSLFEGIKNQLAQLYILNTNFNNIMVSFRSRVDQFYQSVATLNNIISNQLNGLLVTSNCKIIGQDLQAIYNIFCINFMVQIVTIGICTIVMLLIILAAMFTGVIFGVRYANIQQLKRINGEHQQILQISSQQKIDKNGLDKQIVFSQQSHSSQEDQKQKQKQNAKDKKDKKIGKI